MRRTIAAALSVLFSVVILPLFTGAIQGASAAPVPLPDAPRPALVMPAPPPPPQTYTVQPGDTLSKIAGQLWGASNEASWPWLWWANRTQVTDPDVIRAGQVLTEPADPAVPSWLQAAADQAMGSQPVAAASYSQPAAQPAVSTSGMAAFEACVIQRESGGDPGAYNASSGAGGLFQFLPSTWAGYGGYPAAVWFANGVKNIAPVSVQEAYFAIEYAADGVSPWRPYDGC